MRAYVGGGWYIHHLSDRVVELRKDDVAYRRFTGRDGYVRTRIEPQMTRQQAIDEAIRFAQMNDEKLALMVGEQMIPDKARLARYQGKQMQLSRVFGVPGEEERRFRP